MVRYPGRILDQADAVRKPGTGWHAQVLSCGWDLTAKAKLHGDPAGIVHHQCGKLSHVVVGHLARRAAYADAREHAAPLVADRCADAAQAGLMLGIVDRKAALLDAHEL